MNAAIRTPCELIALVLQEHGISRHDVDRIADEVAERLAIALKSMSERSPDAEAVVCQAEGNGCWLSWGTLERVERVER